MPKRDTEIVDRSILCDEFQGNGNLWRGDACIIKNVRYYVVVSQEIQDVPSNRFIRVERPRPRTVSGHIFASVPPSYIRSPVELELEDGSRWPCIVHSGDGDLVTRGMIRSKA
jgi:hypothetical protein